MDFGKLLYFDLQRQYDLPFEVKLGNIYTRHGGLENSVALEVYQFPYGFSFDVGATKSSLFAGVSKDLLALEKYEIDFGTGITSKKDIYAGFHIRW